MIGALVRLVAMVAGLLAGAVYYARRKLILVAVRGDSMAPTLWNGDRVLARRTRTVGRGDVIVFRVEASDYLYPEVAERAPYRVKRVVALQGDPVPRWLPEPLRGGERSVPDGHIVVAGDAAGSEGSASLGYVPVGRVLGVVAPTLRIKPRRLSSEERPRRGRAPR